MPCGEYVNNFPKPKYGTKVLPNFGYLKEVDYSQSLLVLMQSMHTNHILPTFQISSLPT